MLGGNGRGSVAELDAVGGESGRNGDGDGGGDGDGAGDGDSIGEGGGVGVESEGATSQSGDGSRLEVRFGAGGGGLPSTIAGRFSSFLRTLSFFGFVDGVDVGLRGGMNVEDVSVDVRGSGVVQQLTTTRLYSSAAGGVEYLRGVEHSLVDGESLRFMPTAMAKTTHHP